MKTIFIEELNIEAQLIGNSAYLYSDNYSDVIHIDEVEDREDAKELIVRELEFQDNSSFSSASKLFL